MSTARATLALAVGLWVAACSDGGGDGNGDEEVCPGTGDELVGACHEADGTCKEYRGAIDETDARDDCAGGEEATFNGTPCPAAAHLRGSCSGPPGWDAEGTGTLVAFEPTEEGWRFKLMCVELGGCYDPTGRDDDACYGLTLALVGSCLYETGRCMEFRGGIDETAVRGQCAEAPAGEYREGPCPASTRGAGSCSGPDHGGVLVLFHGALAPEELEQLCLEEGEDKVCYQAP